MQYQCEVKNQPAQPALSIRTRSSVQELPQAFGKAYGAIAQYLGELSEAPAGPAFAAYYNMDMQDLDVEIGFPVSKKLPSKGEIQASQIPGGKLASCLHVGPYQDVGPAYEALTKWVNDKGYQATGVSYEMYLNDPAQTPPNELKTLIIFPLQGVK